MTERSKQDDHERNEDPLMRKITRRELLIGATALSVGVLAALAGTTLAERLRSTELVPLKPESGEAQKSLAIDWLPDTVKRWQPQLEKYGNEYNIDPNLLAIIMTIESGGDPNADSGAAQGLMQIAPKTAEDINNRLLKGAATGYDLKNPDTSLRFASVYIRSMLDQFGRPDQGPDWDETVSLVAAGYNGGGGAAQLYRDHQWKGLEDYDHQTFAYTRYVRVMWQERHDPLSFAYRYWYDTGNGKALVANAEKYQIKS